MSRPRDWLLDSAPVGALTVVALLLTAVALVCCLLFTLHTTGATVFLFSTLSPLLLATATLLVAVVLAADYRRSHSLFRIERLPADTIIFRQGDHGDCAYFIRRGQVEVLDQSSGQTVARLGEGEHFGEMALLTDRPRNATARTATPVELAVLGKENFLNMLRLVPSTEESILATVSRRALERRSFTERGERA